jgi:hypothetical protein
MANGGQRKEFLNQGILGSGAGVARKRGFRPIATDNIGSPEYNSKYFETFPTVWATAYAFRKSLEADPKEQDGTKAAAEIEKAATVATREWATLFLLHYFGILQLSVYAADEIRSNYDKDLWLALSGTYPSLKENGASSIKLLETDDHRVIGAYYSEVVFFPSRSRSKWVKASGDSDSLGPYLSDKSLSWTESSRILLKEEQDKDAFHVHLRLISDKVLQSQRLKDRLDAFCDQVFGTSVPEITTTLDKDPSSWDIPGVKKHTGSEYLDRYPFVRGNEKGGTIYYLVAGMPIQTSWMTQVVESAWPAPNQYRYKSPTEITLNLGKKPVICKIGENDEIVQLKNLFLAHEPYWCKVPRASESFVAKIKSLHTVGLRDPVIKSNEVAVCLAPIASEFLLRFPEVFQSPKLISAAVSQADKVEWTFMIDSREIKWQTTPVRQAEMPNTSLALWPPGVSRDWKLYVAYGQGRKETCGRWHVIDEKGWRSELVELEEEEYVSILQRSVSSNTPKAIMLSDSKDEERGILFLGDFTNQDADRESATKLAVDFGTSNTCLAYKNGQSKILKFEMSPEMIWGAPRTSERAGFVPFKWGGGKGFFPTILLSRKSDEKLPDLPPANIQPEHLFKVDIPCLHTELEQALFYGGLSNLWRVHDNLKWDPNPKTPWRSLFLGLTLLYAHAEVFFKHKGVKISKYTFTYPLAFSGDDQKSYHEKAREVIRKIRQFCYGSEPSSDDFEYNGIDESTAISGFIREKPSPATIEVFIDVGGGTADLAIRGHRGFLVLDSIRVAGNTFFGFAERNFANKLTGASQFKKHLATLLQVKQKELEGISKPGSLNFGTFYSVAINRVGEQDFNDREQEIIKTGMGKPKSYQRYRTRLFFRHIITYALLQACAAVVDHKIKLTNGIKLILGGNAWGLLLFAELPRSDSKLQSEADEILKLLKSYLSNVVTDEERPCLDALKILNVQLLNADDLSKAKISVAVGALDAELNLNSDKDRRARYSGVTIKELRINDFDPMTVRWCDRWGFEEFKQRLGVMDEINSSDFELPEDLQKPFDSVLSVFTCLGNTSRNDQDNMPRTVWTNINAEAGRNITAMRGQRLESSPLSHFISDVLYPEDTQRDFLDTLAETNGNFKAQPNEE